MSISQKKDIVPGIRNGGRALCVNSPEAMVAAVREAGLVPFFENPVPGWSIEEWTPREYWFDGEEDTLGPWDWKIACVQSGDIAYGKFLLGGKAAFATFEVYRELMNWRRSRPEYQPSEDQQRVLDLLAEKGSVEMKEVRRLLGLKKSAADALMARLQMQTRVVTGDIRRVYRGQDLHYNGWQVSTFCTPEALFEDSAPTPGGFTFEAFLERRTLRTARTPAESYEFLADLIRRAAPSLSPMPSATADRLISRLLR